MLYVDMAVGDTCRDFPGKSVTLVSTETLAVERRGLSIIINGVRVFIADTRWVADCTHDEVHPLLHGGMTRDPMVVLSDPNWPLPKPQRFTFPISRADEYAWTMEEHGHMLAYFGPDRSHEDVDLDMHDAHGRTIWPVVAVEDAVVRWIHASTNPNDHYDFEVAVPDGAYHVPVEIGDDQAASAQRVFIEGVDAGGEFAWTPRTLVRVTDHRLIIRIILPSDDATAGVASLRFEAAALDEGFTQAQEAAP